MKCTIRTSIFNLILINIVTLIELITAQDAANCIFKHGGHLYDFNELAQEDYFPYTEQSEKDSIINFYISLCHPLRNVPNACNGTKDTGVCVTKLFNADSKTPKEKTYLPSLGIVPENGFTHDNKWITYTYLSGEKCTVPSYSNREFYKVEVHFICKSGDSFNDQTGSPLLISETDCLYTFAWMTKAACPKKVISSSDEKCMVKFSNSDDTLNLHALHSPSYYNVSNYLINICGPITDFNCGNKDTSVCDVSDPNKPVSVATTENMKLIQSKNDTNLQLVYDGSKIVVVEFFCETRNHKPSIHIKPFKYIKENLVFNVKTSAVCTPKKSSCILHDKHGNKFDLNELRSKDSNWKIDQISTRPTSSEPQYSSFLLNVCGPLNEEYGTECGGKNVGACEIGYSSLLDKNLGFITSDPVVNDDGSITIIYTGGEQCGETRFSRSTMINLYCSEETNFPTFIEVTNTCQYIFAWHSPAACPRHVVEGKDCVVKDSRYGFQFDLNPLRKKVGDYETSDGEHLYNVNICGPLNSACNGKHLTDGVCQSRNGVEFSGGQSPGVLKYNDGTITVTLSDGSLIDDKNSSRSSTILLLCDHSKLQSSPQFFLESGGAYTFIWHTVYACPPHTILDCTVYNNDTREFYDLTRLSKSNMNEEFFINYTMKKYVLNVCRSVIHTKASPCAFNAGACIIDRDYHNEPINIGEVENGPYLEKDSVTGEEVLKLKYENGDICNDTHKYQTTILFKCSDHDLFPQLITEENCQYFFTWTTPHACPKILSLPKTTDGNCTVKSPITDYVYDFSSLKKNNGYTINHGSYDTITLNICDKISNDACDGAGVCAYNDSTQKYENRGYPSSKLEYHMGAILLKYENGDMCKNGVRWSTHISFICPSIENTQMQNKPVLIHSDVDTCITYISWYKEIACERQITCSVEYDNQIYDYHDLISHYGNYKITNPDNKLEQFYINVCRPLNPIKGVNCPPGSSICRVVEGEEPQSLGHPIIEPKFSSFTNESIVMYSQGTLCPGKKIMKISSKILFKCDRSSGVGYPTFVRQTEDCQYIFEWKTILACPHEVQSTPTDKGIQCTIIYEAAKTNINLAPLSKPEGYEVKFGDKTFKLNICKSSCGNESIGVCTTSGEVYGRADNSLLSWDYNELVLSYSNGDSCTGVLTGKKTTKIFFTCDMNAGYGEPKPDPVMSEVDCVAIFDWKTNITCMKAIYNPDSNSSPIIPAISTTEVPEIYTTASPNKEASSGGKPPASHVTGVIATMLILFTIACAVGIGLYKSGRGHWIVNRIRRSFRSSGPTILLLDDQHL